LLSSYKRRSSGLLRGSMRFNQFRRGIVGEWFLFHLRIDFLLVLLDKWQPAAIFARVIDHPASVIKGPFHNAIVINRDTRCYDEGLKLFVGGIHQPNGWTVFDRQALSGYLERAQSRFRLWGRSIAHGAASI